ncbi:hypothetical protein OIU76_020364 [Salix suchowensis]|nr:hypothetical protein OIU76_020364 [Salix suchowensis]
MAPHVFSLKTHTYPLYKTPSQHSPLIAIKIYDRVLEILVFTLNPFLERFCVCVSRSNSLLNGIRYNEAVRCCSCNGDAC